MAETLKQRIVAEAKALGFDAVRFASAEPVEGAGEALDAFLAEGRQGDMAWLASTAERRKAPRALWPEANSVILLGLNYGRPGDPLAILEEKSRGAISIYAQRRRLSRRAQGEAQAARRARAGAGPRRGEDLRRYRAGDGEAARGAGRARLAGQAHQPRVARVRILAVHRLDLHHRGDRLRTAPEEDHCGACRRCLDMCPTNAFTAPYRIDARACISYLTIEHKGHIAPRFRAAMGNRIFGCDDCLAVCPWNKFAQASRMRPS